MQTCRNIHLLQLHPTIKPAEKWLQQYNALDPVGLVLSQQLCSSVVIVKPSWDMGGDVVPSAVVRALVTLWSCIHRRGLQEGRDTQTRANMASR